MSGEGTARDGVTDPRWVATADRPGGRMRTGFRGRDVVVQLLDAEGRPAGGLLVLRPLDARTWAQCLRAAAEQAEDEA